MSRAHAHIIIGILLVGLLLVGCNGDPNVEPFELQLRLAINANALPVSMKAPAATESDDMMREFGDPGETESFELPDHAYIYLVWSEGGEPEVIHVESHSMTIDPERWTRGTNELIYNTSGDPVYLCDLIVTTVFETNTKREWARFYVAVSKGDISPYVKGTDPKQTVPDDEDDILDMVFDNNTTAIQNNLKNIYSTPFNYEVNSKYYGTVANFAYDPAHEESSGPRVARANLLLYHVAAKVDLMWNVKESIREDMKLTYLEAEHLYDGACLLFKPNQNEVSAAKYTGGYSKEIVKATALTPNVGTQWNGRAYFYTIPYKNNAVTAKFPLQLRMLANTDLYDAERADANYYHLVKSTDMPSGAVYVPWVRCQMNINKVLSYSATPEEY